MTDYISLITGLSGLLLGAVTVWIALKKMPGDIRTGQSTAINELAESVDRLAKRNNDLEEKVANLQKMFVGTYEVSTRIIFGAPPRIVGSSEIKLIPNGVEKK